MSYTSPQTALTASVTAGTVSTVVFAQANGYTNGRAVYNDSSSTMYLKFGTAATLGSYTVQVAGNGFYEFPVPVYGGEVDGIWAAASGTARTTSW